MNTEENIGMLQEHHVGKKFRGASLSKIDLDKENSQKVQNFLKEKKHFLVYLGGTGIGKTYFCSALIPWVHGKVSSYRYWNERDILAKARDSIDSTSDYLKALDFFLDDELIIIDDLGSCGINDWRREIWLHVIDSRYESEKPTIITSNLTRQEIKEQLGFRTESRLFSKENYVLELYNAIDKRKESPAQQK